ncbi:MAG: winged helix-turn-helix domain-containing protein [Thermoproteota archaeon]|nr:winged helix-turn-helix domain-containing protein [Thermoproteota archaeon]
MQHRSRIDITCVMLDVARGGGVGKTRMMNIANLSHQQLKEHVKLLTIRI